MSGAVEADEARPGSLAPARRKAIEWPTVAVAAVVYGGWLSATWVAGHTGNVAAFAVAAVLITLHSSMQHEILHGHPTRSRRINRLLGLIPLSLWIPYERYRQTHLVHHIDERLTDPLDDPESYYWTPDDWARLSPLSRWLVSVQTTLLGRMVVGPLWSVLTFLRAEWRRVHRDEPTARAIWLEHVAWCIPVVAWVHWACEMPLWLYLLAVVYPGTAVLLIRSFAEHKALPEAPERTAIVENAAILGPLFLYNNLHALHHENPMIPWYEYPAWYRQNRDRLLAENGGLVYDSYLDVARRFLLWSHDRPRHPLGRIPRRT